MAYTYVYQKQVDNDTLISVRVTHVYKNYNFFYKISVYRSQVCTYNQLIITQLLIQGL